VRRDYALINTGRENQIALRPLLSRTIFPPELFPLAILRTLSGSGSLALTTDMIKRPGPRFDALADGRNALRQQRDALLLPGRLFRRDRRQENAHAIPAALVGDTVAAIVAAAVCIWMFR
jgi:spore maturation protein B